MSVSKLYAFHEWYIDPWYTDYSCGLTGNTQLAEVKPEFNSANISFGGYISTPFFPLSYPDDLTFEQVISCKIPVCLIHLTFVDFQIAEESIVEVFLYIINY